VAVPSCQAVCGVLEHVEGFAVLVVASAVARRVGAKADALVFKFKQGQASDLGGGVGQIVPEELLQLLWCVG